MGAHQNNNSRTKKASGKPKRSLDALRKNKGKGKHEWAYVQADALHALIGRVIKAGDAISFSQTSDGGAVVVTLMVERDREKFYATSSDELNMTLGEIYEFYDESN